MSIRFALWLVLFTWTAGCGRPADSSTVNAATTPVTVRIGYQKIGAPFLLKERAEGLRAELAKHNATAQFIEFQAGPPILEAMRAGAVDIGYTGDAPPVFAQAGGVPFVYVARDAAAPASEAILVPNASPIQSVAELEGKRIALNRGSNVHYLLLRALADAKLSLQDVQISFLAPPDARAAFESGRIDAWLIWDPFQAAAEVAGARVLRDGTGLVDNNFFYLARREFAERHAPLVGVVLGEFKTLASWAGTHHEEAARILSQSSGISYEALLKAERRHNYEVLPVDSAVLAQQQRIADEFRALDLIPQAITTSAAFLADARFGGTP